MVVIISLFFCLLTVSLFGGSVYVLVDKIKLVKRQNQELEAYRAKVAAADEIINAKSQIIANANQIAESTILKAKKESDERSALCERLDSIIAETQMQNANLRRLKSSLEEDIELCNLNFYKPHYDFEKALDYERALFANRNEQKAMIQAKKAVIVERGAAPDKKLAALLIRLLLRTFNSECDLLIQNVDFKNVVTYENRINNSFEQLNKLTLKYYVMITSEFLNLKLEELRIYHEFQEKKQLEAEEQRQIREIMREEIRAERELEKAKAEAEKEEQKYQSLLDKAMEAARQAQGVELERMNAQIADCCCKTQSGMAAVNNNITQQFCQLNYNNAMQACEIKQAIAAEGAATRQLIQTQYIAEVERKLAEAKQQLFVLNKFGQYANNGNCGCCNTGCGCGSC